MRFHVTELLVVDQDASPTGVDQAVAAVRGGRRTAVHNGATAIEVLVALGRERGEAERHVHYCLTGQWEN